MAQECRKQFDRAAQAIRRWITRHRKVVTEAAIKGASYKAGGTAISLIIVWWQSRH
ncbi:hypothetical protein ACF05L_12920 [Streptomyces bobili]|uniref:hypothetical protein n=1 Tax=Streptomyces bobili TaxID=67280 RepID=UPI0036FCDEC6